MTDNTDVDQTPAEKAFRAGFDAGYKQGEDDQSRYEFGGRGTTTGMQRRARDNAWQDYLL